MTQLVQPDLLIDIEMSNVDSFDYNKSEKIINIGRTNARKALSNAFRTND